MKRIAVSLFFMIFMVFSAVSQHKTEPAGYFAGINPIAPFTSIPNQLTNLFLPLVSNLETGFAANAGIMFDKSMAEARISYGKPNKLYELFQFHTGFNHFIFMKNSGNGLYAGGFIKYYQLENSVNSVRNSSLIPYFTVGYRIEREKIFFDFRLNQNIYSVSWSNQENTSLNTNFHFSVYDDISPVLPYLSVNIGYVFKNQKGS